MNVQCKSAGYFDVRVIRPDGSVRESLQFQNLITDIGLVRMGSSSDYLGFCRVGTGSTEPQFTDTQLVNQVASRGSPSMSDGAASTPPYYGWARRIFTFSEGAAEGVLAEIGIGWASSGTTLFSRSLLLDQDGNPTTITVLDDEILIVTYEHRYYVPMDDWTGSVTLQGNLGGTYSVTGRSSEVTNSNMTMAYEAQTNQQYRNGTSSTRTVHSGEIRGITSFPSGTSNNASVGSVTIDGLSATYSMIVSHNVGNFPNGIRSVRKQMGNSQFQFQFDPPIPKTSDDTLELEFKLTWGRYEGGD